jgi:hypothetical protein
LSSASRTTGVVGIGNISGDPPSELRQIVNGHLDRPVNFEYITCEVDDKAGGKKRVAAIVVPDSRRRPHMASREIKERRNATYPQWRYGDDTRRFWRVYNRIR